MQDRLSQTFSALADPTRRAMLARLSKGQANVSDLAKPFLKDMSLPAVTKHLKVLENAGLVTKTRDAQWRPCTLNAVALRDVSNWMETYRSFWEESFDRLDIYLKSVAATEVKKGKKNVRKK
ncbi:MAG: metalloregulator ArsR/SmtB family transcription factor [Bdellovibrionota bacterium]